MSEGTSVRSITIRVGDWIAKAVQEGLFGLTPPTKGPPPGTGRGGKRKGRLIPQQRTVRRGSKTYQQTFYVAPEDAPKPAQPPGTYPAGALSRTRSAGHLGGQRGLFDPPEPPPAKPKPVAANGVQGGLFDLPADGASPAPPSASPAPGLRSSTLNEYASATVQIEADLAQLQKLSVPIPDLEQDLSNMLELHRDATLQAKFDQGNLHVGDTINKNGRTYRLNDSHRWERIDEKEAARVAKEAAERVRRDTEAQTHADEAEKKRRLNQKQAALADAVYTVTGEHCTVNLWSRDGADRRLYFDEGDGYVRRGWKVAVYIDGNSKNRPGTVEGVTGHKAKAYRAIADIVAKEWKSVKLATSVYSNRDDLAHGGEHKAAYQDILSTFEEADKAAAEEEKRKRREYVKKRYAPLRELGARYGANALTVTKQKRDNPASVSFTDDGTVLYRGGWRNNLLLPAEHNVLGEGFAQELEGILKRLVDLYDSASYGHTEEAGVSA